MENRIRELRQQREIKQTTLAKYLGIAPNTLSYWEQGRFDMDNASLVKIANFFDCSIDYLLYRDNISNKKIESDYFTKSLSKHERNLILAYRNQPNMQESVCRVLGVEYQSADVASPSISKDISDTLKKEKTVIQIPTE